jgi:peptidoglycan glycosyltransferase
MTGGSVLLVVPVLWVVAGNLGIVPFTGVDVPFLAANGSSALAAGTTLGLCEAAMRFSAGNQPAPVLGTVRTSVYRTASGRHLARITAVAVVLVLVVSLAQSVRLTLTGGHRLGGESLLRSAGTLLTRDGLVIAQAADPDGPRVYAEPALYADLGWRSPTVNARGVEHLAAGQLTCGDHRGLVRRAVSAGLMSECAPADVVTTISSGLQAAALDAATKNGATTVVALNARTGAVLAAAADPALGAVAGQEPLSVTDVADRRGAARVLLSDGPEPAILLTRPFTRRLPPGSVFKIVTGTAAAAAGVKAPALGPTYEPGAGVTVGNAWDGPCPSGTVPDMLAYSCNTTAAWMAGRVGQAALTEAAAVYGFDRTASFLAGPADPTIGEGDITWTLDAPTTGLGTRPATPDVLARTSFGQQGVRASVYDVAAATGVLARMGQPLTSTMVAGTCVDNRLEAWSPATPTAAAARRSATLTGKTLRAATEQVLSGMRGAVQKGTATALRGVVPQHTVAAKTGTAQTALPRGTAASVSWVTVIVDDELVLTVAVEPTADEREAAKNRRAVAVAARLLPALVAAAATSPSTDPCAVAAG